MPVINVDGKIAALVVSIAVLRPLSSSQKHFMSLPSNGQGVSEDDDSRIETELTTCPTPQKLLDLVASI
jgi:hypothetical protein